VIGTTGERRFVKKRRDGFRFALQSTQDIQTYDVAGAFPDSIIAGVCADGITEARVGSFLYRPSPLPAGFNGPDPPSPHQKRLPGTPLKGPATCEVIQPP